MPAAASLRTFFIEHNVRHAHLIEQRIDAIRAAPRLTQDEAVIAPNALLVETLVAQLRCVLDAIEQFDRAIAQTAAKSPTIHSSRRSPAPARHSLPDCSSRSANNVTAITMPHELQKYSGVAPVTESSGKSRWVHWRYAAPTFLRQTFVEWAAQTIPHSFWARAFYDQQRAKGALASGRVARACLQVDPHRVPMLAGSYAVRRDHLPQRPQTSWLITPLINRYYDLVLDGAPQGVS